MGREKNGGLDIWMVGSWEKAAGLLCVHDGVVLEAMILDWMEKGGLALGT